MPDIRPVSWADGAVHLLDQTRLPVQEQYIVITDYRDVAAAIRTLRVRGAPAIGVAAAYGVVLAAHQAGATDGSAFLAEVRAAIDTLAATRPTAVNLFWALRRMRAVAEAAPEPETARRRLLDEARRIHAEQAAADRAIGRHGADLIPDGATVLTHCNTGALATAGHGTAHSVIRTAAGQGKRIHVLVDETRPLLQGARLTAWELRQDGIPATLITDGMAGSFMRRGLVTCVVVGADRIAANGDVANKIGTYSLAALASVHGLPFYVAAPTSTIDLSLPSGDEIPIEERRPEEVTHIAGARVAPEGVDAANPAFDVTPAAYVTAVITERGVARAPYRPALAGLHGAAVAG